MPKSIKKFDVVIVGGGPAGMSAAQWCSELGLSSVLIEKGRGFGGQLALIHNPISNYLGHKFADGIEALKCFDESLKTSRFETILGCAVSEIDIATKTLLLADGRLLQGSTLVLAMGVRRRKLHVQGEVEFAGRGVLNSGVGERESAREKTVVVIGGGDAAFENAIILSKNAASVILVHRRDHFSARAEFVARFKKIQNLKLITNAVVESINGKERVESVTVRSLGNPEAEAVAADFVLIRIGVIPNSELVAERIGIDAEGYIAVDECGRTSAPGVFAVGDVANPRAPTLSTAIGTAATAIKSIEIASN